MAKNYLTPGVYVEEISHDMTVPEVRPAVPAFIGYTGKVRHDGRSLLGVPEQVASFPDFVTRFGGGAGLYLKSITIRTDEEGRFKEVESVRLARRFLLHEAIRLYFANGGGECYVVSVGSHADNETGPYNKKVFEAAIEALETVDDVTLLVMPEAVLLGEGLYGVQQAALKHCAKRRNRFTILDLREETREGDILLNWRNQPEYDKWQTCCKEFRDRIGIDNLSYGAAYTPYVVADVPCDFRYAELRGYFYSAPDKPGGERIQLSLAALDPAAKDVVRKLDITLADQANLEAAMALAAAELSSQAGTLSDAVRGKLAAYSSENMRALADTCWLLFARLLGVAPKAEGLEDEHALSADLAEYVLDQLNRILDDGKKSLDPAYESAGKSGSEDLLSILKETISELPEGESGILPEKLTGFLDMDLHQAILKNVDRLANGLSANSPVYHAIVSAVQTALRVQPPSAMMAGIYAGVDRDRGVWKAPANVSAAGVLRLTQAITAEAQEVLNSDPVSGKSINALRSFPGRGVLVWGARTLDGNSQEWRYIPVRRFFIMVEESIRRATIWAVFEPNTADLWARVKAQINNYLMQKWKEGALMGADPSDAYFVNVGLGSTMIEQDILEGRLIVEFGMAVVRPAEFIILRFSHTMQSR